jgi:peptide/nickel transport system substrate-binding protein
VAATVPLAANFPVFGQDATTTLIVAGPRTPESLDQEYPPTEAVHEARRNINEPLLRYASKKGEDGITYEDFGKIEGGLAESWDVSPDKKTITFHLRRGVKSSAGNELTADDVMWTFQRGWTLKANFHWYTSQVLNVASPEEAFKKSDDHTVQVSIPYSSPLVDRLWTNIGLGILDAQEVKKHVTAEDPWGSKWLAANSASYGPYFVTTANYTPGQQIVYEANPNYYRGAPRIKRVIFREMPTSANRVAALEAGSVDVAEFLQPRELALLQKDPRVKVWKVYGNYVHRVEMNMTMPPFTDERVRQALNYLVPREQILKAVYFDTARLTKSPISEIYPGYTDKYFIYGSTEDVSKAKELLAKAGLSAGFKTELGYRAGDQIEEEIAVILKSAFAKGNIDLQLVKLPASTLVERYSKGDIPMWFYNDMAIVPDSAYVANLWLNSASVTDYPRFKDAEVDTLINNDLKSTDEAKRLADSARVQEIFMEAAPWLFLMNPGYQLATRTNVKGYAWYTPNSNDWYDFYKE